MSHTASVDELTSSLEITLIQVLDVGYANNVMGCARLIFAESGFNIVSYCFWVVARAVLVSRGL
jgi:hypothetical protein